jgi:hypothetical protein
MVIEPLWVWAANKEPSANGADNSTVLSYLAIGK